MSYISEGVQPRHGLFPTLCNVKGVSKLSPGCSHTTYENAEPQWLITKLTSGFCAPGLGHKSHTQSIHGGGRTKEEQAPCCYRDAPCADHVTGKNILRAQARFISQMALVYLRCYCIWWISTSHYLRKYSRPRSWKAQQKTFWKHGLRHRISSVGPCLQASQGQLLLNGGAQGLFPANSKSLSSQSGRSLWWGQSGPQSESSELSPGQPGLHKETLSLGWGKGGGWRGRGDVRYH